MSTQSELDLIKRLDDLESQISTLSKQVSRLENQLTLVTDIDLYSGLRDLLEAQDFRAADQETSMLMTEIAGYSDRDNVTPNDISKFPCSSLTIIDRLWANYSEQKFGFSAQLSVYRSVGGNEQTIRSQDIKTMDKFGEKVGWRLNGKWRGKSYDDWNFTLSAPQGAFPAASWKTAYGFKMVTYLFGRLMACKLS